MMISKEEYLKEALISKEPLTITSINSTYDIIVYDYDLLMVYYYFKNKTGKIYKENILQIKFKNEKKEKQFQHNHSVNKEVIEKFTNYYFQVLDKTSANINGKKALFTKIFDQLYDEKDDNLLLKYIKGITFHNEETNTIDYPILMEKSNESQKAAIKSALNNKISVIEGPPGTGKTTTILSIIANLITQNKKVVVVSKNNTAVNNIIEEFSQNTLPQFYIRFGKKEIMTDLKLNENDIFSNLKDNLQKININYANLTKLQNYENELKILEPQINDLINIKRLLEELKIQKKFIDKKVKLYNFWDTLNPQEKELITKKNANLKTITRLIEYARKEKYNFIEKILIKYRYTLKINNNIKIKLQAIITLLTQYYIDNEITVNEKKIINNNLENMQKKVSQIYDEYIDLSINYFKYYLKQNLKISNNTDTINRCIETFPLILTTADGFLFNFKNFLNWRNKIDCLIIDEASQCDILTGIPLLFLTKKIIVVGDSKQLSAITNENIEYNIDNKYRYENNNFLKTIKEVFNPPCQTLLEHYRCDFNIINFCNKYYYDNELIIYKDGHEDAMSIINADKYKGAECKNNSFCNQREIKTITYKSKDTKNSFYITPFKEQANLLIQNYNKDVAGTIHTFQGKGSNTVYFSTVLNNFPACLKHIKSDHNLFTKELINVAVSRAKKQFILVTDRNFFLDNTQYVKDVANLINYIDIYGKELKDESTCCFDYLYRKSNYQKNKYFDNQYEEELANYLNIITSKNNNYIWVPKIFLSDLILNEKFLNENPAIKSFIKNGSHADFTIIDTRCHKPVLVIELDGKYHELPIQKERDEFKNKALNACNIKVLRIPSKSAFNLEELKQKILATIPLDID